MTIPSRFPLHLCSFAVVLLLLLIAISAPAAAQSGGDDAAAPPPAKPPLGLRDETEQNVITVPTTTPMHRFGSHFRITHRFARDILRGDFGGLAADFFGLDSGAIIGLDYRFAPMKDLQAGVYRTTLYQTIQFSGRYDGLQQGEKWPLSISTLASVEGTHNFRENYAPAFGVVASKVYSRKYAFYASPTFVWNSGTPVSAGITGHEGHDHEDLGLVEVVPETTKEHTAYVGLGTRVLLPKTVFIALEFSPRLAGFAPGRGVWGVGIEKHTRGHLFQLNWSNSFGTTYGQVARGGEPGNVYLGFNISRKF